MYYILLSRWKVGESVSAFEKSMSLRCEHWNSKCLGFVEDDVLQFAA